VTACVRPEVRASVRDQRTLVLESSGCPDHAYFTRSPLTLHPSLFAVYRDVYVTYDIFLIAHQVGVLFVSVHAQARYLESGGSNEQHEAVRQADIVVSHHRQSCNAVPPVCNFKYERISGLDCLEKSRLHDSTGQCTRGRASTQESAFTRDMRHGLWRGLLNMRMWRGLLNVRMWRGLLNVRMWRGLFNVRMWRGLLNVRLWRRMLFLRGRRLWVWRWLWL